MKMALLLVAVVAAFAACDGADGSYEDVEAVVEAMEEGGIECEDLETTTEFGPESDATVTERGFCVVGSDRVVISTFDDAEDRDEWVEAGDLFGKVAVGENWVIGSDSQELTEEIANELDARIPEAPSDEAEGRLDDEPTMKPT